MPLATVISIARPFIVALGSALLVWIFMEARMDTLVSRERALAHAARSEAAHQNEAWNDRVKAVEETARRRALDEMLREIHMEERRYLRRSRSGLGQAALVIQERLSFRGIPLSPWTERVVSADRGEEIVALLPGSNSGESQLAAGPAEVAPRPAPMVMFPSLEERGPRPAAVNAVERVPAPATLRMHREPKVDPYRDAGIDIVSPFIFDAAHPGFWEDDARPAASAGYPMYEIRGVEDGVDNRALTIPAETAGGSKAGEQRAVNVIMAPLEKTAKG